MLLAEQNKISKEIGVLMREGKRDQAEGGQGVSSKACWIMPRELEERKRLLEEQIQALLIELPNVSPIGARGSPAEDNKIERTGGKSPYSLRASAEPSLGASRSTT